MANPGIPYYIVKKGFGYWQPTKTMRDIGAKSVPCGPDGPTAWERARRAEAQWTDIKRDELDRPGVMHPHGTLADAFARYRRTGEWAKKAARTREEWGRCWQRIDPIFGDVKPASITLEDVSAFRGHIAELISEREAHRCIKIWRALWKVAAAMRYCHAYEDPSFGVRNTEPRPRQVLWREGEVVRLVKAAWRRGYHGLAALMATSWDTQLSPVDVRGLTAAKAIRDAHGLAFILDRAKTGRGAVGTLTPRAERIVDAYIARLGVQLLDAAPIFRNRSGRPYSKDTLGDDFRDIRALVFGEGENRTLADFRRSGAIEAIRGGAKAEDLASKMANDLDTSKQLHKTYAPVDLATARGVDEARRKGRRAGPAEKAAAPPSLGRAWAKRR
jgi:hypothetical protein